jgi:hypothetical protein
MEKHNLPSLLTAKKNVGRKIVLPPGTRDKKITMPNVKVDISKPEPAELKEGDLLSGMIETTPETIRPHLRNDFNALIRMTFKAGRLYERWQNEVTTGDKLTFEQYLELNKEK